MLEDIFILRFGGADPVDFMTRSGVCFVQGVKKFDVGLSKVGIDQERPPCIIDQMKKFLVSLMACNFYGCGTAVHFVKKSRWVHGENEKYGKKKPLTRLAITCTPTPPTPKHTWCPTGIRFFPSITLELQNALRSGVFSLGATCWFADYQLFVEARCDQLLIVAIKSRPAPTCFAITIPHALQTTFPEMLSQELQNRHDF